ncbi:unnamed protein product [Knipowitschia caucasica]
MNYSGDQYYEKITAIQQSMHGREKRRLELERELFAYCRSDKRVSQIKCAKLRRYLRDISDREERAKMRNLDLLREVSSIEMSMKRYHPDPGPLMQMKADVMSEISKCMDTKTNHKTTFTKIKQMDCQPFPHSVNNPAMLSVVHQQTQVSPRSSPDHILPYSPKSSRHVPEHLDSYGLNDQHKRMTSELPTAQNDSECNEHKPPPAAPLTAADDSPSPSSPGPVSAAELIGERKCTSLSPGKEIAERCSKNSVPENNTENNESSLSSEVNLSSSKSSALSLSLTQSELDEDLLKSEEQDSFEDGDDRHSPNTVSESLSQKGLFRLMDTIEGQLHDHQSTVYSIHSIDAEELNRIISLCNRGEDLNGEDSTACGAVVLHELQRLSWSTEKGCLLPQDVVSAHQSCNEANQISDCLPPDAAQLWDRWFKHALLLKEHHVLSTKDLVQLFTPLLLERHATYGHQAKVLLRTLLSRSSEECPSAEDESNVSSFGPDSKVGTQPQLRHSPEQQSSGEDSLDQSPVESVPIKASKAYQLLKQSAMQKRIPNMKEDDEEECDLLRINEHEEDSGWANRSLHQDPYSGARGANSKAHSALQSKAILEESDDSDSEIEAALRPQPFSTNSVGTGDFFH